MGRAMIVHIDDAPPRNEGTNADGRHFVSRVIGDPDAGPWIYVNHLPPGRVVPPHSHTQDEVIFIVEGDLEISGRSRGPGTVVYMEKGTEYGFTAGQHGVRFLNVRPGLAQFQIDGKTKDPVQHVGANVSR